MKVYQHGKKYRITYRWRGSTFNESFDTQKEAQHRANLIELEMACDTFLPPSHLVNPDRNAILTRETMTVAQLMKHYVEQYGLNHWSTGTLADNQHRIDDYIIPYIGDMYIKDVTTHQLEQYYQKLQTEPAVPMKGREDETLTISISVIEKIHTIIRSAFNQAIRWDFFHGTNPAQQVILPRRKVEKRNVWSDADSKRALELCDNPALRLCMMLAVGCSMRIGEILGLTWDCVHIEQELIERNESYIHIEKELRRCKKDSISALQKQERNDIFYTFPEWKQTGCTTALVLKAPKTESSVRTVYLPQVIAEELVKVYTGQESLKAKLGAEYQDFNLVVAQSNGRPFEEKRIAERMKKFISNNNLPPVVFHSLRHTSTSIKLRCSGGDIKAVQGDTGHAQSNMVTDVYAHIMNEDRKRLAQTMNEQFFASQMPQPVSISEQESERSASEQDELTTQDVAELFHISPDAAQQIMGIVKLLKSEKC